MAPRWEWHRDRDPVLATCEPEFFRKKISEKLAEGDWMVMSAPKNNSWPCPVTGEMASYDKKEMYWKDQPGGPRGKGS